jgi:hypothetical protein
LEKQEQENNANYIFAAGLNKRVLYIGEGADVTLETADGAASW